jgi:hypothetical protein
MTLGRERSLGSGRLALIRVRRRWTFAVAVGIGIAASVAIAGAVSLVQSVAAESALQITLRNLGDDALIDIAHNDVNKEDAYQSFQAGAARNVRTDLGARYQLKSRYVESRELYPTRLNGVELQIVNVENSVQLASYEDLASHVKVVAGSWPTQPVDHDVYAVTLSTAAASKQGLKPGDVLCLQVVNYPLEVVCTKVAAVWRPKDASEPYWGSEKTPADFLELDRQQMFDLLHFRLPDARAGTVHAVFAPNPGAFHAADIDQIRQGFRRLDFEYSVRQLDGLIRTGTDTALDDLMARSAVAQFAIQLVAAQMLVVALYYLAFMAGHSLEQQRQLFAVWRSRGFSWFRIWRLLMLEFAAVAVVAVPVGLGLAWLLAAGVTRAVYAPTASIPPALIGDQALPVAVVIAVALAVLAASAFQASRKELLQVRRLTSRPQLRAWWQWRYIDIGLALLSIPLLLQARLLGQSGVRANGLPATDPTSLLLPAIAMALIALAALRLLPLAARLLGAAGRGLDQRLASWQLSRHPVQHARLALLLAMAIALGIFSSAYAATQTRNGADRAAYAAGADLRADFQAAPSIQRGLAGLKGVRESSLVWRDFGRAGHSIDETAVLAVDPSTFAGVAWSRPDLTPQPLSALMQLLVDKDPTGLALPGRPVQVGVWAFSTGVSADLTARITDARGRSCECDLGGLEQPGWRYLQTPIQIRGAGYPLKLRELALTAGAEGKAGEVALSDLGVLAAGGQPAVVESFEAANRFPGAAPFPNNFNLGSLAAWWRTAPITGLTDDFLHASQSHPREGRPTTTFEVAPGDGSVLIRPPARPDPVPVLAPRSFLDALGTDVGAQFPIDMETFTIPARVVGLTDHFPTLYPEQLPFLITSSDAFLADLAYTGHPRPWPNEAWMRVDPAHVAGDARLLRTERPAVNQVLSSSELAAAARVDPEQLSLESNLLIGFLAAMALAVVGFIVHFLVVTRGRLSDYAILQANGMPARLIRRSLGAEQLALLAFSIVAGGSIGLALAWVLLPAIQVGTDLSQVVPPTVVTVDPVVSGMAVAIVAAAALAGGALSSRVSGHFRLMDELRLLG